MGFLFFLEVSPAWLTFLKFSRFSRSMKRVEMKYKELGNQLLKANPEKVRHQAHKSSKKYEGKLKWQKVDHSTADIATVLTTSRLTTTNSQSTMSEGVRRQSADDVTAQRTRSQPVTMPRILGCGTGQRPLQTVRTVCWH